MVWTQHEPVSSPLSAQPGLKIPHEWASGDCATVSVPQMEMAGPCESAHGSTTSSTLQLHRVVPRTEHPSQVQQHC